jgi:hypothetical protein
MQKHTDTNRNKLVTQHAGMHRLGLETGKKGKMKREEERQEEDNLSITRELRSSNSIRKWIPINRHLRAVYRTDARSIREMSLNKSRIAKRSAINGP